MTNHRLVLVALMVGVVCNSCGSGAGEDSSGAKGIKNVKPFFGEFAEVKIVDGQRIFNKSMEVTWKGGAYSIAETLQITGRTSTVEFDGERLTIDGKQYSNGFTDVMNTPYVFWLRRKGEPTGASETVCGRKANIYESRHDTGSVERVVTMWVDAENGTTLQVHTTSTARDGAVVAEEVECRSITYF